MAILSYEHKFRVAYKDTDQMGVMHHSNYVVLYEKARTEWLRHMGITYAEIEQRGIMSPIMEVHSKYIYPAFYDELLTVRVLLEEMPTARFTIHTEVFNQAGKLINKGYVVLGFISKESRRPCRIPTWFQEALEEYIAQNRLTEDNDKE